MVKKHHCKDGFKMGNDIFIKKLKSGSDIRGVALEDTISGEKIELTNEIIEKICRAFVKWVAEKNKIPISSISVAVGHDSRISASRIKNVIINTLRCMGVDVYDCSLASTPAMYMAISVLSCTASIQITASHHPFNRNGFKFFTSSGGVSEYDIDEILDLTEEDDSVPNSKRGNVRSINIMEYYSNNIIQFIRNGLKTKEQKPLEGIKIVVDAGNGVGGFFANKILKPLGADVDGSIYLEPDGNFPNHVPNPENSEAMKCIAKATVQSNADLGIIFDTDVDRAAFIAPDGSEISRNKFIAIASYIALEKNPNGVIVTDSVTSDYLQSFIEKLGGIAFRYKRGYNNVISMAKKIIEKGTNCPLAIESSGHAAFKENNFLDDGAFLAAKIIIELVKRKSVGENLNGIIKGLVDAKERLTLRIPVSANEEQIAKLLVDLKNYANSNKLFDVDRDNIEGVRINFNSKYQNGWILLRKSVHDPVIVLDAESYVSNGIREILNLIQPFLKRYKFVDISVFNKKNK